VRKICEIIIIFKKNCLKVSCKYDILGLQECFWEINVPLFRYNQIFFRREKYVSAYFHQ